MIVYDKLFTLLTEKGLNKAWLRNNGINAKTVDRMIHNKSISVMTINRLCLLLDCEPADIMTFTKTKEEMEWRDGKI